MKDEHKKYIEKLTELEQELYGDGIHDDTKTMQKIINCK
jgi:hypothetical protein